MGSISVGDSDIFLSHARDKFETNYPLFIISLQSLKFTIFLSLSFHKEIWESCIKRNVQRNF